MDRLPWRHSALMAVLLLGTALRLAPWGQNRFLEDEALYGYWGLQIATGADPMLDEEPVDKPPLHPYTLALSFLILGTGPGAEVRETAARLPSLMASLASIALVYALGRALFRDDCVGLLAALLLALSPFDILFASTAFTDPLMTALVLGALLAAARGRLGAAGVLAGLAVATKQQGLFFLPLVVAVGALSPSRTTREHSPRASPSPGGDRRARAAVRWCKRAWTEGWLPFALSFAAISAGVIWWDSARVQRPGFIEQSLISYGGLGPAQPEALGERLVAWLKLAGYFWASPFFNALLLAVLGTWLIGACARWWPWSGIDVAIGAFVILFLVGHWLVGFQVWDRYLLGLVPLVALLVARAFVTLGATLRLPTRRRLYAVGLAALLLALLAEPALKAARSELPLGGDHGAYDGINQLVAYMRDQAPPGAVLYHYWLGHHYRFYLYDAPLRLHWYPDPGDLAHDATVYRREPRYIAFPSWRDGGPAEAALSAAGIDLAPVLQTMRRNGSVSFRLYTLVGP